MQIKNNHIITDSANGITVLFNANLWFTFSRQMYTAISKRLSLSVDTGTKRNCGVQATKIIYYF